MSQIDEETERRGVAVVTFNMGKFNMSEAYLSQARMGSKSADAMPARMTSLHQCFTVESYSFGVLVDYVTRLMPKDTRAKVKIHRGEGGGGSKSLFSFSFPRSSFVFRFNVLYLTCVSNIFFVRV